MPLSQAGCGLTLHDSSRFHTHESGLGWFGFARVCSASFPRTTTVILRTRPFLILGLLCASVSAAFAVTEFKDNFTSKLNSKWKHVAENKDKKGNLVVKNKKLTLVTTTTRERSAHLILNKPLPKVTESWETQIVLQNKAKRGETWIGVAIANADDPYRNMCGVEFYYDDGERGFETFHYHRGEDDDGPEKRISGTKLYVRMVYRKSTKLITLYQRTSTSKSWKKVLSYSPFNDRKQRYRGNWDLDPKTGKFSIVIFAGAEDVKLAAGTVTADSFVLKN